jgi:hypothetical protein
MLEIAKNIVLIKTNNQLKLLKNIRNKEWFIKKDIEKIKEIIKKIPESKDYESLL